MTPPPDQLATPVPTRWPWHAGAPRGVFTTGQRLFLAFALLVAVFMAALLAASSGLRRMTASLEDMRVHEEELIVSQALESAVRDQSGHHAQITAGEVGKLAEYREAQGWVHERIARLGRIVEDAEERERVRAIEAASRELDAIFDARIAEALAQGGQGPAQPASPRAYALIERIEDHIEALFTRQVSTISHERGLVAEARARADRWILVFLVAGPAFALAVGVYIQRSVTRPVALLAQGARRLARGEMATRIEIGGRDEFGALAAQFNAMTQALRENQARLVESEKLAGVGRMAAGLAHEMNNPLSVMLGFLTLHRRKAEGALARHLGLVEREARRCQELVQDMLDLSRPDVLRVRDDVDLRQVCEEVVATQRESGQAPAADLQVSGEGTAAGDAAKLRRVVVNLVRNAADAAGPGGRVLVEVSADGGAVQVAVRDTGPGLTPEIRARLFEPFYTTKPSGTGLGLAVSRAIVRAHGGELDAGNAREGGAVFTLRVPRAAAGRA